MDAIDIKVQWCLLTRVIWFGTIHSLSGLNTNIRIFCGNVWVIDCKKVTWFLIISTVWAIMSWNLHLSSQVLIRFTDQRCVLFWKTSFVHSWYSLVGRTSWKLAERFLLKGTLLKWKEVVMENRIFYSNSNQGFNGGVKFLGGSWPKLNVSQIFVTFNFKSFPLGAFIEWI